METATLEDHNKLKMIIESWVDTFGVLKDSKMDTIILFNFLCREDPTFKYSYKKRYGHKFFEDLLVSYGYNVISKEGQFTRN